MMIKVQVIPVTEKGKIILKENTDKFGINKFQSRVVKKVGDRFTITEIIPEPFSIVITVKAEYEKYVNKDIIYDKTMIAVEKIMIEHQGSLKDVSIEVKDD